MCIQTIVVKFPSSLTGRMPEHGQFPMHLSAQSNHNALLIGSNDYVAMLKLGEVNTATSSMPTTHNSQLCCAIYNTYLKQVRHAIFQTLLFGVIFGWADCPNGCLHNGFTLARQKENNNFIVK